MKNEGIVNEYKNGLARELIILKFQIIVNAVGEVDDVFFEVFN